MRLDAAEQVSPIEIREFQAVDHASALALWATTPGVVIRDVDELGPITAYLARNPGLSFVAVADGEIIGTVLCGSDGRRGYLYHLAVRPTHRGRGIGRTLAERAVRALADAGIDKCHLMVVDENQAALDFWRHLGWTARSDVRLMSHTASGATSA